MDRDEFIELLARLVADGVIDDAMAVELLLDFDAGMLGGFELPLQPAVVPGFDQSDADDAMAVLLALLALRRLQSVATVSHAQRIVLSNILQDDFERTIGRLANRLADGRINLAQWQQQMQSAIRQNAINQMRVGSGRATLNGTQRARLDVLMRRQGAYLQRWADQLAGSRGRGLGTVSITGDGIALRGRMYGGFARAEFFTEAENSARLGSGWIVQYQSLRDNSTCGPCIDAEGYYLLGSGPMPGEVCEGRHYCRCQRVPVYDPAIYADLAGQPADVTIR